MKAKFAALSLALAVVIDARAQVWAAYEPMPVSATHAWAAAVPQSNPDFGGPTVTVRPVTGMTVQLPKGWAACDDANNALLGRAADKLSLTAKVCAGPKSGGPLTFGAFDPRPFHTVSIYAGREPEQLITEAQIAHLSAVQLKAIATERCPLIAKPIIDSGAAIDSCTLKREMLGGHIALVSRVVYTPQMGAIAQGEAEGWVVATDEGVFDFDLTWPVVVQGTVKPVLDAIRASLEVK